MDLGSSNRKPSRNQTERFLARALTVQGAIMTKKSDLVLVVLSKVSIKKMCRKTGAGGYRRLHER